MGVVLRYLFFTGIAFLAPFIFFPLQAQDRCGTVPYSKHLHPEYAKHKLQFEKWVSEKQRLRRNDARARKTSSHYQIPVVVHIIHNGEAVGTGPNVTDAQVLSQIRVLNEDFNRQNADTTNTPAVFKPVAGRLNIEFVLAKQDPDGLATNGIVRVDGDRSSWTMNDNYKLKSLSYWPSEEYLNIWVANLTDGHAGYAQFPESDLPGLETSSTNRLTDGVVIWHKAFGSEDDGPFTLDRVFNKGRTTTHEVGHFFGLNHIWGDESACAGTDYVSDTPNQGRSTDGCPTHPKTDNCSSVVMFQNFLDYTNDACMNLFTEGQVSRMTVVLENSPRRNSLLSSPALHEPAPLPNDLGIRAIVFPDASVCSSTVIPILELRNHGSNAVTSTRIRFIMDGTVIDTKTFSLSLNPQETVEVSFDALPIPSGAHDISFQILSTNGGTDSGSINDFKTSTVVIPFFASTPVAENFNTQPPGWITQNPDGQITWQIATAPNNSPSNKALKLNFHDYEDHIGEIDIFLSPVLDLKSAPAATLTFDVAHARYQLSNDRLQVIVLTDCEDRSQGTIMYDKAGDALKTAPATTSPFTPTHEGQWRKELLDLSAFVGFDRVQIAFVGINDWGNNLYLDNISLFTESTRDIALVSLVKPAVITCVDRIAPEILIQNSGSIPVIDLAVDYQVNNGAVQSITITNLNLEFGGEEVIVLPEISLPVGTNTLTVLVRDPYGLPDANNEDNSQAFTIAVNQERDRIPLRENFDDGFAPAWTVVNPQGGVNWETIDTNFDQSLYFNSFNSDNAGDEAWFASPVLDFSGAMQASMLFDLSYATRGAAADALTILASTDCGVTYDAVSFNMPAAEMSDQSWRPQTRDEWSRNISVNLNSLAGEENVRIAFVVRNQQGNNVYLDNIEFFTTADPDTIEIEELYSVYGYDLSNPELSELRITFNLPERQSVRYSVINVAGQLQTDGIINDVLNQTYPIDPAERLAPGVYFIRVRIAEKFYTSKILIY